MSACCGRDISLGFIILSKYFYLPKNLFTLLCKKQRAVIAAHRIALVRFPALIRIRSQFRRQVSNRELAFPPPKPLSDSWKAKEKTRSREIHEHRFFPALSSPRQNPDGNDTRGTENPQQPAGQPRVQRDGSRCAFACVSGARALRVCARPRRPGGGRGVRRGAHTGRGTTLRF